MFLGGHTMIEIKPFEEVQVNPFGFSTNYRTTSNQNLHGNLTGRDHQDQQIKSLLSQIQSLNQYPCDVHIKVGIDANGTSVLAGKIYVSDQTSKDKSEKVVESTQVFLSNFREQHPESSFAFTIEQRMTITKIYYPH